MCELKISPTCSTETRVWYILGHATDVCQNCFDAEMNKRRLTNGLGPGRGYTKEESIARGYTDGQSTGMWMEDTGYHPVLGPKPVFAWEALTRWVSSYRT